MEFRIETYGCSMNKADSEAMAGLLLEAGFSEGGGGVLIVNTCTVKTPTEKKILRRLRELAGRRVVVAGCLPAATPEAAEEFPGFSFIGTNVRDVVEAVKAASAGKRFVRIGQGGCCTSFPKRRENPVVEIIPIAHGCVGDCSYCITRYARGCLRSYPLHELVEAVEKAVSSGAKEIWLTGQDTGAYGLDVGENLPSLLTAVSSVEGEFRARVGMMNPGHVLAMADELAEAFKDEKIYRFLHLPLQSGDDSVLSDMNRGYTVEEFKKIVSVFRAKIPELTLSTDVIVGFPTEDGKAFKNTMQVLEETKPEVLNVSRFWLRPKTKASGFKQLPGSVTKERSRKVDLLFRKYALEKNKKWVGWEGTVLVSERAKNGFCARNQSYKPIIVKSGEDLLGRRVRVRVTDATYYDLRADLL